MIKNPKFSDLKVSPLFAKGKLIKARCLNTLTKKYILQFNLNSELKELEKCIDKNK